MNLVHLLLRSARWLPDRPALALGKKPVRTYREMASRVSRISSALRSRFGLHPAERVALAMKNCVEFYEILFACWHAGLTAVPMNAKLHPKEFAYILEDSGAKLCFVSPDLASAVPSGIAPKEAMGDTEAAPADVDPNDVAWLFYTSGTTGVPKGAMLTHRNMLFQTHAYFADIDKLNPGDTALHPAPLSHGSGLYGLPHFAVGAVNVKSGELRYFDSREGALGLDEVMASGALPPGFPAIRVDGEAYWDGGLYSNTPLEAVLDDSPRRDSLIFGVNVWQPTGHEPESLWQVMGREKDIRYASRDDSNIARQKQIHRLRHVIRELSKKLPAQTQATPECRGLASWGCGTTMHVVRLLAPALDGEDYLKDLDFSASGIEFRCEAGFTDARSMIERAPWEQPIDPMEGVIVHELSARKGD